jgi:hypothetical protein
MDHYLLNYIRQQLVERGFKKFHHEPVSLLTNPEKTEYRYNAYNEFFFLVSKNLANGTVIRSDTNIFDVDQHYNKRNLAQIQEFTGLIIVTNPRRTTQLLEFIRVIPQ